ncbi:MAG: cation diffusion facilitator family transporter [Acidimicrobiia bacterium]
MGRDQQDHTHNGAEEYRSWVQRLRHGAGRLLHFHSHDHDHGPVTITGDTGAMGIRATKVSLVALGVTALFQVAIFMISGSVALLSDTLHNFTDALTAIPLWIAFAMGRKKPTRRYTFGFNRVEDIAGLMIVAFIGLSAVFIIWESVNRLFAPRLMDNIPWVVLAGIIGALGNELVARYRIRIGRQIGSEALITDGHHARTDAMTSLAVVAAAIGAAFGAAWVDPVAGLVVALGILWLLVQSGRRIARRLLDGVEPEIVDDVESTVANVVGVLAVPELRVRWHGHQLHVMASVSVDPELTVREGHELAHTVEHELHHRFQYPVVALIHVDPYGDTDAHETTAHHAP